jgi:hypothetical protein
MAVFSNATLLYAYWKLPLVPPPVRDDQPSDRAAAKVAALIAIFFLGLAIRDRSSASGLLGSSTISAAAAVVAGVVDRLSNRASARLHDGVVISAYASTIVAMVIYLVCETVLVQTSVWYQQYRFGWEILAPVLLSGVVTYVALVIFSVARHRSWIGWSAVIHGLAIVAVTSAVVYVVARVPAQFDCFVTSCPGTPS